MNYPMDVIAASGWKLTLPVDKAKEIKPPALLIYADDWFRLNANKDGVVFRARTDGATTGGSKNPRSELRELSADGKKLAAWSSSVGVHSMEIEQSIDVLPIGSKPHVVVGQIHDRGDDVTVFRFEGNTTGDRSGGKLWITDGDTTHGHLVTDTLKLGERFRVGFRVAGERIEYTFNGQVLDYVQLKKFSGAYFKAGCYNQSGGNVTKLADGTADYAEVTIYALQVCHDGVCFGHGPVASPPPPPTDNAVLISAIDATMQACKALLAALGAK